MLICVPLKSQTPILAYSFRDQELREVANQSTALIKPLLKPYFAKISVFIFGNCVSKKQKNKKSDELLMFVLKHKVYLSSYFLFVLVVFFAVVVVALRQRFTM